MNPSSRSSLFESLAAQWRWIAPLLVVVGLVAGVWWFVVVPLRIERLYGQAVEQHRKGDYAGAIATLERAYAMDSREVRVNTLLGWCHWQLEKAERAEFYFARAHHSDPKAEEARRGLALASLALGKGAVAVPLFQELAQKRPQDKQIQMWLGEAYVKSGQNVQAAKTYRAILERDPADQNARWEFLALYGYPEYRPDLPLTFSPAQRSAQPQMHFRTRGNFLQILSGEEWKNVYLAGVNIGPARPGEFPSTASRDFSTYLEWLKQIGEMNANTVRLYTVLPPAFYQALKNYNETTRSPLWLVQEVWIHDEVENLYDPAAEREFQRDVMNTIDLLHGQATLGYRHGYNYGIYTADVSRYVLGLAVGREIEPRLVQFTNAKNPSRTAYKGHYVSLEEGTPTEAWFARMCDLAVRYEVEKYNTQRPLTVVNWPPLDPLTHPTENTYADELRIRKDLGEPISEKVPPFMNDADVVSVDIVKFKREAEFEAGLFALYHVYQHWPDFLFNEPSYAPARDAQGPNRYLGYLRELKKAHANFPLLIGEYGLATSLGAAHLHPQGWNNGGLTEKQQAELLVRFTTNIRETGCAGGLVFEWNDEWFKHVHDYYTADFERPWDRDPLWLNALDPEENFGIVGFEPVVPVPLLRGSRVDWLRAQELYAVESGPQGPGSYPGELRAVHGYSDFAYFYLRLDVESAALDWNRWNHWIALNNLPGQSGSKLLPEIGVQIESGANFLIQLTGPSSSRILVAENYNPNARMPVAGRPGQSRILRKQGMKVELAESAAFQEILTEANEPRYGRDGRIFPALNFNRSPLPFGTADRAEPNYSSHALWYVDAAQGMIELRIPWGLLLVMDPSNLQAFGGTDAKWMPISRPTPGISVAVFVVRLSAPGGREPTVVSSSVPPVRDGKLTGSPAVYTWEKWNQVQFRPYLKESYFALQRQFAEMLSIPTETAVGRPAPSARRKR